MYESDKAISLQPAPAAVTAKRFVTLGADGVSQAGESAEVVGVAMQSSPDATVSGNENSGTAAIAVTVPDGAKVEVECGAAIAAGAQVTSDAQGRAVTVAAGQRVLGHNLLATGAAGEFATIVFLKGTEAA